MSQADSIRRIAPEFLRVAYEISMSKSSGLVSLDIVAEHLGPDDLGVTGPDYVDLLSRVAQYLGQKGLLKRQSDEWGLFSMTSEGISEVEASLTEVDRQRGGTARVAPQTIRVPFLATLRTSSATHHRWVSPLSIYKRA